ncbi:hypothetical protein [uncultured Pelagimonas sp.]|uniref:hypothetical protein n=1 Tax=uncultured Pelagimonas sp. TaxID=1618102 RepID=UPI002614C2A1|nr:hypothetical protein [uncultured Pelagimonas sp.]
MGGVHNTPVYGGEKPRLGSYAYKTTPGFMAKADRVRWVAHEHIHDCARIY